MAKLNHTTLTARLDGKVTRMKLASVTGRAKNDLALIDAEIILVNRIDTDAKTLEIQRGYGGTQAEEHANGSLVWIDKSDLFLHPAPSGYANEAQSSLPRPALPGKFHVPTLWMPLNGAWVEVPVQRAKDYEVVDPKTGSTFLRVKASAAIGTAARWVVIDPDGDAAGRRGGQCGPLRHQLGRAGGRRLLLGADRRTLHGASGRGGVPRHSGRLDRRMQAEPRVAR